MQIKQLWCWSWRQCLKTDVWRLWFVVGPGLRWSGEGALQHSKVGWLPYDSHLTKSYSRADDNGCPPLEDEEERWCSLYLCSRLLGLIILILCKVKVTHTFPSSSWPGTITDWQQTLLYVSVSILYPFHDFEQALGSLCSCLFPPAMASLPCKTFCRAALTNFHNKEMDLLQLQLHCSSHQLQDYLLSWDWHLLNHQCLQGSNTLQQNQTQPINLSQKPHNNLMVSHCLAHHHQKIFDDRLYQSRNRWFDKIVLLTTLYMIKRCKY